MRCEEIQVHLSAYVEDEIEPGERQAIEGHLLECARCRHEIELLRRTVSGLKSLEEIEVPPRLTASIQAGIEAQGRSRWRDLTARLFFPLHIKLPLEAMALVLVALGAVYVYRSAPELAQAPRPQAVAEFESREKTVPEAAGPRVDWQEEAIRKRAGEKPDASSPAQKKEEETLREADVVQRSLRQEAPAIALRDASLPEMTLRTDPSQAASRIASLVERIGGKVLETRGERQFIVAIPASSYSKFVDALGELGEAVHPPAEAPSLPSSRETVTFSLRLIP